MKPCGGINKHWFKPRKVGVVDCKNLFGEAARGLPRNTEANQKDHIKAMTLRSGNEAGKAKFRLKRAIMKGRLEKRKRKQFLFESINHDYFIWPKWERTKLKNNSRNSLSFLSKYISTFRLLRYYLKCPSMPNFSNSFWQKIGSSRKFL